MAPNGPVTVVMRKVPGPLLDPFKGGHGDGRRGTPRNARCDDGPQDVRRGDRLDGQRRDALRRTPGAPGEALDLQRRLQAPGLLRNLLIRNPDPQSDIS